ncbi:MAG TPA: hypothetical protein VIK33_13385 [Anaerolineae bacterium]
MATLPDADRLRINRALSRWWSAFRERLDLNETNLNAAIAATDTWINDNAAAYNAALPVAARTSLTAAQKTLLFVAVALMRHDLALLRRIFSEVD